MALIRKANAQLAAYTSHDPYKLDDEQWAMAWNELIWIRKKENEKNP